MLKNPANRHRAVGFTHEQWHYAFTNTFSEEESRALYERYHIPASGRDLLGQRARQHPSRPQDDSYVELQERRPGAAAVHLRQRRPPDAAVASSAPTPSTTSPSTVTEVKEFEGPHLLPAQEGWEEVADYALEWALAARRATGCAAERVTGVRITHIGGPTTLIEVGGWRLLTDPTFDPPGRTYRFGWGTGVAQARRAGDRRRGPRPIDAVLLTPRPPRRQPRRRRARAAARRPAPSSRRSRAPSGSGGEARGLAPWATTRLEAPGRPTIEVTATPCRHGPPLSHPIVGDVIGFALRWEGQEHGVLWISGDTVLYDGVREVADRLEVGRRAAAPRRRAVPGHRAAALHDDRATTRSSCAPLLRPRTAIPIHYEGWTHFRQGRDAIERGSPPRRAEIRERVRWLPIGVSRSELPARTTPPRSASLTTGGSAQRSRRPAWNALNAPSPVSGLPAPSVSARWTNVTPSGSLNVA